MVYEMIYMTEAHFKITVLKSFLKSNHAKLSNYGGIFIVKYFGNIRTIHMNSWRFIRLACEMSIFINIQFYPPRVQAD